MASPPDGHYVMGYPTSKQNQQLPLPGYGIPGQPGAYPPPPPPHPGYPGYMVPPASKNYVSPSFNVFYNNRNNGPMGWGGPDENSGKKFGQVMLVTMVTLIICMCMLSVVIWLLFGMEIPEFRVSTFTVSNLNVSDSMIRGNWDANISIFNPNPDVKLNFESIRSSIFYKNYPLAMSPVEAFNLQGNQMRNLVVNLDNQTALSKPLLSEQMEADRRNGALFVSLRISLGTRFQSRSIWRKETLRVFCEDLKLNLAPEAGMGTLVNDVQNECLIFT